MTLIENESGMLTANVTLPETPIDGNGFKNNLSVTFDDEAASEVSLSCARLDGQFFGPNGEELGANIWGNGAIAGDAMVFQGLAIAKGN